jgi:hypothetical protein
MERPYINHISVCKLLELRDAALKKACLKTGLWNAPKNHRQNDFLDVVDARFTTIQGNIRAKVCGARRIRQDALTAWTSASAPGAAPAR